MNLCIAHGHSEAFLYPIGLVMDEANFISERESSRMVTESVLLKAVVDGVLAKEARKQFSKLVKTLNVEVKPAPHYFGEASPLTPEQREGPQTKKSLAEAVLPRGVSVDTPDQG